MSFSIRRERKSFSQLFTICFFLFCSSITFAQRGVNYPVATVSAASYEANAAVAPESIASSFGTNLTTVTMAATDTNPNTRAIELPTNLGGTTVQVNNVLCGLLYVSPAQINFVMPEELGEGTFLLTINALNGTQGGTVKVSRVQPSIFSMNSDGPASVVRVKADGTQQYETLAQLDTATNRMIPKPIDLGSPAERVFLEIYLTGIRQAQDENNDGNLNEHVAVILGGKSITPSYAGKQGFFAGVDQVNVEIPRTLIGAGKINLSIYSNVTTSPATSAGFTSNTVELELAPSKSATPPTINNISLTAATVGETLTITGTGFLSDNKVTFGGIKGDVETASATQLIARIPYGAKSGKVKVINAQGEAVGSNNLQITTSLSGIIETSTESEVMPFPLQNITVRIAGTTLSAKTNETGKFFISNPPTGEITLEIDPSAFPLSGHFRAATMKTTIQAERDNALPATTWLTGNGLIIPSQPVASNVITGILTDTDGITPVPNALMRVVQSSRLEDQTTVTDSNGCYIFRNVTGGTVIAEAIRANGKVLQTSQVTTGQITENKSSIVTLDLSLKDAPANRKPIIIAPETATLKVTQSLDIPLYVADPDPRDSLQITASGMEDVSIIAGTTGAYTLRLKPSKAGTFPIEIKAIDSQGNQATNIISVIVTIPSNQPPYISNPFQEAVLAGSQLSFNVTAGDPDNGQIVQLIATGLPDGATFTTTSSTTGVNGVFKWTPTTNQAGFYKITFTAKDDGYIPLSTTSSTNIDVRLPVIAPTAPTGWQAFRGFYTDVSAITSSDEDNTIYLGNFDKGIYSGWPEGFFFLTAFDLGIPNKGTARSIAVSDDTKLAAIDGEGVYRNTIKTSLSTPDAFSRLTVTNGIFFYYSKNGGEALYSSDKGVTWSALSISKFISDGKNVNYAQGTDGKIYKISATGNIITKTLTNLPPSDIPQAVACTTNKCFAATVVPNANNSVTYISSDNGISWEKITNLPMASYTALFGFDKSLFANTDKGAFSSEDEGATWVKMTLPSFETITVNSQFIIALSNGGAYIKPYTLTQPVTSQEVGSFPQSNIKKLVTPASVNIMAFDNSAIFIGTNGKGVLQSKDGGLSWVEINTGITFVNNDKKISSLTKIGDKLFCATSTNETTGLRPNFVSTGGVFTLPQGSESWSLFKSFSTNLAPAGNFIIGEYKSEPFIYYSQYLDTHLDWTGSHFLLPYDKVSSLLELNGEMYVGLSDISSLSFTLAKHKSSIYKLNAAKQFSNISYPVTLPSSIISTPILEMASMNSTLYAIDKDISFSSDFGKTWKHLGIKVLTDHSARSIVNIGNKLVISCSKGLLVSTDPQKTWQLVPLNLDNNVIKKLFTNGTDLFCLTEDGSVYQVNGL